MATQYSDEVKAQCLAALLAGQSVAAVARAYRVPVGTVKSWKSRQKDASVASVASHESRERIGELLLGYLAESLEVARAQLRVFRDPEWLKAQTASEVGVLHGIIVDKSVRLLEALGGGDGDEAEKADAAGG